MHTYFDTKKAGYHFTVQQNNVNCTSETVVKHKLKAKGFS